MDDTQVQLHQLSRALLRLHKALLDGERIAYEQVHGPITSNGAFLQLLLGHAWFAWLRELSGAMAALDELAESKEASARTAIIEQMAALRILLTPSETGEGFSRRYGDALQRDPNVVQAHEVVTELLR